MIVSSDLASVSVSPAIVFEALSLLKHGKGNGSNLSSDHFLSCSDVISPFLSQLFTCMIRHGYVPSAIRNCVLQPLLKPGKDPCKSDSYRPITLAPTLSKVFERCILIIYNSAFFTSPLQFGFKKGYSTTLCSGLINNVISHYVFRGSRVFGCFLDASKAFDRVDHHALFQKLLRRNLLPVVVGCFSSGINNSQCKLDGILPFLTLLVSPMVFGRAGFCHLFCSLSISMTFCWICISLVLAVFGSSILLEPLLCC